MANPIPDLSLVPRALTNFAQFQSRSALAPSAQEAISQLGTFLNQMENHRSSCLSNEDQILNEALDEFDRSVAVLYTPSASELDAFLTMHRPDRDNMNNLLSIRLRDGTYRFIRNFTIYRGLTPTNPYTVVVNPVSMRSYIPSREIHSVSNRIDRQPLFHQLPPDLSRNIYAFLTPRERALCTRTNPSTRSFFDEQQIPGTLFVEKLEKNNSKMNPMPYEAYLQCERLGVMPSASKILHFVLVGPITEAKLRTITEKFPKLETLDLRLNTWVPGAPSLLAPLTNLLNLRKLRLNFARDGDLAHLPRGIQALDLWCSSLTSRGFAHLAHLPLKVLNLGHLNIDQPNIPVSDALIHLPTSLQKLKLSTTRLSDEDLVHLARLRELRILFLSNNRLTGTGLNHLGQLPLQFLDLQQNPLDRFYLPPLPHLQMLCLRGGRITNSGLADIARSHRLRYLDLSRCEQFTDQGLSHLRSLSLEGLKLRYCNQITDAGIAHLRGRPMQELDMEGCFQIRRGSLGHVMTLPNLKKVCFPYSYSQALIPWFHPISYKFSRDFEWGLHLIER